MSPPGELALRATGLTKRYGQVVACEEAALEVRFGQIHAVLGENGAGKSTLLSMLYGEVRPDAGSLQLAGQDVRVDRHSPEVAIGAGVGLVHQHFMLVPPFSVLDNVILGREPTRFGMIDTGDVRKEVAALAGDIGLSVDLDAPVSSLSVGEKQRVEILKVLWRGARVLLLDEPTAVLTPFEVDELGAVLRRLVDDGRAVVIVTHKLGEVMDLADAATVLRGGKVVQRFDAPLSRDELARAIIGEDAPRPVTDAQSAPGQDEALRIDGLVITRPDETCAVNGVSVTVRAGEIVGFAGVEGNGQRELLEGMAGLTRIGAGSVFIAGKNVTDASVAERVATGLGHVPEDRHHRGLAPGMTLAENFFLGRQRELAPRGWIDTRAVHARCAEQLARFDVRPPEPDASMHALSGGNQQKLLVARELSRPGLVALLVAQPTRGVDFHAARTIHEQLREAAARGVGVLLVSSDLDELRLLSHRIVVLYRGAVTAELAPDAPARDFGAAMTGSAT